MEMQKLNIDDLKGCGGIDYCDSGLLLVSGCRRLPKALMGKRLDFHFALCCRAGECMVAVDGGTACAVVAGSVFVAKEGCAITGFDATDAFEADIVGYTWDLLEGSPSLGVVAWTLADLVSAKPVTAISPEAMSVFGVYFGQMRRVARSRDVLFRRELMLSNVRCVLYVFIRELDATLRNNPSHLRECKQRRMRDFFDLLAARKGRVRSVVEAAGIMGMAPKYLSRIIMETTGLKALRVINDYTLRNVALLLRDTDIPISAIAREMGFDNLSFFGKFVRHATGLSPTDYRAALKKYGMYGHALPRGKGSPQQQD